MSVGRVRLIVERKEKQMFEFKTLIITKRGFRLPVSEGGKMIVPFSVHKFHIESEAEANAIIAHPTFAGWEYGISVGYSREKI